MEYKVVPFAPSIDRNKGNSEHVAQQLEELISEYSSNGWDYVGLESVSTYVRAESGCFGIGGSPGYATSRQMIVLSKK